MSRVAILHEYWLTHPDVGADEIAVLAVLALHANRSGSCFPTQGLLASLLGRSRPWVNKTIGKLVALGLVIRTHRVRDDGGDRACLYQLVFSTGDTPVIHHSDCPPRNTGVGSCDTESPAHDTVKASSEHNNSSHSPPSPSTSTSCAGNSALAAVPLQTPSLDWQPTADDCCWAAERFPAADLTTVTERFVQRCRAKGYRYQDLSAAWRSWLTDDTKIGGRFGAPVANRFDGRLSAWAKVARHHSRTPDNAA